MGVRIAAAALLLALAFKYDSGNGFRESVPGIDSRNPFPESSGQKTTKDKIYTKEQAARGAELYVKHCERCHTPEKVPADKKPGPPVVGAKFLETWVDRQLGELFATILNTMPSDGSAVLTVDESLDATAYLLKANGFPEGTTPLKNDDAMKNAIIVK